MIRTVLCVIVLGLWPGMLLDGIWRHGEVPYPRGILESAHLPWARMSRTGDVRPANPLLSDPVYQFIPWDVVARKSWQGVRIPSWNPGERIGTPFLANPQAAVLDPVRIAATAVGYRHASAVRAWLRLFLAGIFCFGFLRHLGGGRVGALFGATAFELGGFLIPWLSHPHAGAALFLPAVLWAGDRLLQGGGFKPFLGLSLAFSAQFLAGHPETSLHLAALAVLFWVVRAGLTRIRRWLSVVLALGTGVLLASPLLIPFLEYLFRSAAFQERSGGVTEPLLPFGAVSVFAVPRIFGWPLDGSWSGPLNANEVVSYLGILPWILSPWAFREARHRRTAWAVLAMVVVSGAVTYGMPGLREILEQVPGFAWAANRRFTLGIAFGGAILGGLGLNSLLGSTRSNANWIGWTSGAVVLIAGFGALAAARLENGIWTSFRVSPGSWIVFMSQSAMALSLICLIRRGVIASRWAALFLAILALDLAGHWRHYQPTAPPSEVLATTPAIEALRRRALPGDRVLALSVPGRESVLTPNVLQVYGLHDLRDYDALGDPVYQERLLAALFHPTRRRLSAPELNVFGHRFIAAPVPLERLASTARLMPGGRHTVVFDEPGPVARLVLFSYLVEGERYEQDQVVGTILVREGLPDGRFFDRRFPLRAGRETADWAISQFGSRVAHRAVDRARTFLQRDTDGRPYARHVYRATLPWSREWGEPLGAEVFFTGKRGFLEVEGICRESESGKENSTRPWTPFFRGELLLYENPCAWPRAFLVSSKRTDHTGSVNGLPARHQVRPARITVREPGCIQVEGEARPDEVLVVTEASYPGWTAVSMERDVTRELEIMPAWDLFQSVSIGSGPFVVTFRYRPWSFRSGLFAAGAGLLILLAAFALRKKAWDG